MEREIEALHFGLLVDAQTDGEIDHLEQDKRSHGGQNPGNKNAHGLIQHLVAVAVDQAGGSGVALRVLEDGIDEAAGKNAGKDGSQGSAGAVHAEGIEGIVVAEPCP